MTEDEAKTKFCCGPNGESVGQFDDPNKPDRIRYCAGSACMAWRWGRKEFLTVRGPDDVERNRQRAEDEGQGFCGLAGKP